ncbi:MAG TPA: helix-turn-helix domain-containing protein [Chitinophagaceae bacterium]
MSGIQFNIWAIIILFGAAQGLFLAVYLFTKPQNRDANKWLALLLTVISLHLIEYAANIAGATLQYPIFIAITYPLLFCMGPFYYIYCRYLLDKNYSTHFKSALHFLPSLIVLLMMLPFYGMANETKINFITGLSTNGIMKIPSGQLVFMGAHVIQTVTYIFAAYKFIGKKEEELKKFSSDVSVLKKLGWLNAFSLYFSIYLLLYFILVVLLTFINSFQIQLDYILLLITSISIYAIGYSAISNPEIFKTLPEFESQSLELNEVTPASEPRNSNKFPELKEKLLQYMDSNKPYLKSDLKISELADSLAVPYYQLSQLINDEFLVNFYDFINKYRVEEAKKLLIEDTKNYKILAIAYEVGFNSKATFNRVFKKFTDLTPSEFKEKFSPASGDTIPSEA